MSSEILQPNPPVRVNAFYIKHAHFFAINLICPQNSIFY